MINYRNFDVVYDDAGEQCIKSITLYGKTGDTNVYSKPAMAETDKVAKSELLDILKKGAVVSYKGEIYIPKKFADEETHVSLTIGDDIVLNSKPETEPTVAITVPEPTVDLLGKTASELQSDIQIKDGKVTGTLHHVSDYTGFSSISEQQEGWYLATKCIPDPEDAKVHVYKTNGTVEERILDADLLWVAQITDKNLQKLQVYVDNNGVKSKTVELDLSGLTLEPAE